MAYDIDGLLALWTREHVPGPEAEAEFGRFYTDPVVLNGTPTSVAALVERAIAVRGTFATVEREVLDVAESDRAVAVVFRMSGRQTGPLSTSAGVLPATGQPLSLRVIDLLRLDARGRIASVWMAADELGALAALGAVSIRGS